MKMPWIAKILLVGSVLMWAAACSSEGTTCASDKDCAPAQYCAKGGGVFFSTDHCVARSAGTAADVGAEDGGEVGEEDNEAKEDPDELWPCGEPCQQPTPQCDVVSQQCVACLSDSDCGVAPGTNFRGVCKADHTCWYVEGHCGEGFVDLDQNPENGCECAFTDANDRPDTAGVDENCDGVDGVWDGPNANVVFLSVDGDDVEHSGLRPEEPLASIARAIETATEHNRPYILMTGGDFRGPIRLADGVHLYGGYAPDLRWTRALDTHITRILPAVQSSPLPGTPALRSENRTILAEELTQPTILDGLTIVGPNVTAAAASSYAIWSYRSEHLIVQNTLIQAGTASRGESGALAKDPLICIRLRGGQGAESNTALQVCPGSLDSFNHSGISGEGATEDFGQGGRGGVGTCVVSWTNAFVAQSGEPGMPGKPGDAGQHGVLPPAAGSFDEAGQWVIMAGLEPSRGSHGGGGGGGGAGGHAGFVHLNVSGLMAGGNGGAGGSGGCGRAAGQNGKTGGSSFGIAVIQGALTVRDSVIQQASGGAGGHGSAGNKGLAGLDPGDNGQPGLCNNYELCGGNGGPGGRGGRGGDGGHGVGGHGGHSIGIALAHGSTATVEDSVRFENDEIVPAPGGSSPLEEGAGTEGKVLELYDLDDSHL